MTSTRWKPLPAAMPHAGRELAERLRALLDDNGMSLRQLAAAPDVHYSLTSLQRYFSGQALPPRQLVDVLSRRYASDGGDDLYHLYEQARQESESGRAATAPAPAGDGPADGEDAAALQASQASESSEASEAPKTPETRDGTSGAGGTGGAGGADGRQRRGGVTAQALGHPRGLILLMVLALLAGGVIGASAASGLLDRGSGTGEDSGAVVHDVEVREAPAGEMLSNGTFDHDRIDPWWSHLVNLSTEVGLLRVDVPGGSRERFDAQIGHSGLSLKEGERYTLRFTVFATERTDLGVKVLQEKFPLAEIRSDEVQLGPAPKDVTISFTSSRTTHLGQVIFRFGGGDLSFTAYLDNISLVRTSG